MQSLPPNRVTIPLILLHNNRASWPCDQPHVRMQQKATLESVREMVTPDHVQLASRLTPAVLAAGVCLLGWRGRGVTGERKADGSPVSGADREAESIVVAALENVAPTIPVIAEEAVSAGRVPAFFDAAFLVDALDGTTEYLVGGNDFTVNVALVAKGVPVFGMLLAPASGRLFVTLGPKRAAAAVLSTTEMEAGAMPPLKDIAAVEPESAGLRVLLSRTHRSDATDSFLRQFKVARIDRVGSSLKFGLIAAGEADIYPRLGPTSAWDIAAGHAVLAAAGGSVITPEGAPVTYLDRARVAGPEPFLNPWFVARGRPEILQEV